ncbi:MAG: saccharopine dehydrogenase NADP-binding domain-containing protein [Spirochaetales bacterium]|nr:saccharopine dehydrogenase NADP-binding domain-containing protein [Spirochaetales bacterium]
MARILILGGYGFTGRLLARHLLEQSEAQITLAGRHLENAQAYAEQLNTEFKGERVSARRADAASRQSLHEALDAVDLLLVAAPTTQHADTVIRAALESDVDYLDIQLDAQKLALLKSLAPDIARAGRCFITEAGFHPGLPAAMVHYAARRLDRLDTAVIAGYLNMGRALPYSDAVDELMEVFRNYQAQFFRNREWTRPGQYEVREVGFGGEIGVRKCYSMFFEELRALPQMYPTLQELGFFMSGSHWLVDWIITPLVLGGLKLAPRRGIRPLGKLMWWGMQTFSRPPYRVLLKVEARGENNGKPVKIEITISHSDAYELTAIPVVACLLQYLDGSACRPGLWMMGHLVEPVRLFRDMEQMGVRISQLS